MVAAEEEEEGRAHQRKTSGSGHQAEGVAGVAVAVAVEENCLPPEVVAGVEEAAAALRSHQSPTPSRVVAEVEEEVVAAAAELHRLCRRRSPTSMGQVAGAGHHRHSLPLLEALAMSATVEGSVRTEAFL